MTEVLATYFNNNENNNIQTNDKKIHGFKKSASFITRSSGLKAASLSTPKESQDDSSWIKPIATGSVIDLITERLAITGTRDVDSEDAFFVADLGEIARQQIQFKRLLPRVDPFYGIYLLNRV